MKRRLIPALILLPLLFAGCVGYQFGTSLPGQYKTVHVKPFVNKTGEPNLEFASTKAALSEFQRDGSLGVTDGSSADLVLETTLMETRFDAVRFSKTRSAEPNEYRMIVEALITLTDRKTGTVLIAKRKVLGESTFRTIGDSQQARLSAQPRVSDDLAHQIVKNVVEFW
jgi:hypothetical protein